MTNVYKWATLALLAVVAGLLVYSVFFKVETPYQVDLAAVQADIERLRGELADRQQAMDLQLATMEADLKTLGGDLGTVRATTAKGIYDIKKKLGEIEEAQGEIDHLSMAELDARLRELVRRYQAGE